MKARITHLAVKCFLHLLLPFVFFLNPSCVGNYTPPRVTQESSSACCMQDASETCDVPRVTEESSSACCMQDASETCYVPRVNFCARLEPKDKIINGAGQDAQSFEQYNKLFAYDRQPLAYMTYIGLNRSISEIKNWGSYTLNELNSFGGQIIIPQIGLFLAEGKDGTGEIGAEIRDGQFDQQILVLAETLKSFARPVFLRIGYEFEGPWNNYNPATFIPAWIRITDMLRKSGAQFATVWNVAGGSSGWPRLSRIMEFYPGAEWVDWWSVNLFSADEFNRSELMEFLDAARSNKKPVMIGEMTPRYVGVLDGSLSWDRWFRPLFNLLKRRPEIKAISYINWDWPVWAARLGFNWFTWRNAQIQGNATVREWWTYQLSDPVFLNASVDGQIPLAMDPCAP